MSILPIVTAPDSRLLKKSLQVEKVDERIRSLMKHMVDTMYHDKGVGLAAVQVGVLQRVIVIDLQESDDTERHEGFYPLFLADPNVIVKSEEMIIATEGCLSLPEQVLDVARSESVTINFLDYNNSLKTLEADGWLARVVQHEMDHLDGKLLLDYMSSMKKNVALRRLKKLKNDIL